MPRLKLKDLPFPWPNEGNKVHRLLSELLNGVEIDPFFAVMELNMPTYTARITELRSRGWCIRSRKAPHPKFPDERVVVNWMDKQFIKWVKENPTQHPFMYEGGDDGRGSFVAVSHAAREIPEIQKRPRKTKRRT